MSIFIPNMSRQLECIVAELVVGGAVSEYRRRRRRRKRRERKTRRRVPVPTCWIRKFIMSWVCVVALSCSASAAQRCATTPLDTDHHDVYVSNSSWSHYISGNKSYYCRPDCWRSRQVSGQLHSEGPSARWRRRCSTTHGSSCQLVLRHVQASKAFGGAPFVFWNCQNSVSLA